MASDRIASDLLTSLLHGTTTPLGMWDAEGYLLATSAQLTRLLETSQARLASRTLDQVIHPDDRPTVARSLDQWNTGDRSPQAAQLRLMTATGSVIRTHSRLVPLEEDEALTGVMLEVLATGDEVVVYEALDEQAGMFHDVFNQLGDAVYSLDSRGRLIFANPATERLFGRTFQEFQQTRVSEILFEEGLVGMRNLRSAFDDGNHVPGRLEFRIRRGDGEVRWVSASLVMQRDATGRFSRSWVVARDVTRERESREQLARDASDAREIAFTDPLTGLQNRRAFDDALARCADQMALNLQPVIAVIDLDQLKSINDRSGHQAGDDAIRTVAQAINHRIRAGDQAFRIGGDEFAVILTGGDPMDIESRLSAPIPFVPPVDPLLVSIGTAVCGVDADQRMFEMKRRNREAR